jgi:hypothetical protein
MADSCLLDRGRFRGQPGSDLARTARKVGFFSKLRCPKELTDGMITLFTYSSSVLATEVEHYHEGGLAMIEKLRPNFFRGLSMSLS